MTGGLLVVAKAPVPGFAKTRMARTTGPEAAADLAAAALLDVLEAAAGVDRPTVVALAGRIADGALAGELATALAGVHGAFAQVEGAFGDRLAHAHHEAHRLVGGPVVQIGMDTPQVTSAQLADALGLVTTETACLGPASDGGWWALGLPGPGPAQTLSSVPMSRADTGSLTRRAIEATGLRVADLPVLRDVDEWADAVAVAEGAPHTRFARRLSTVTLKGCR